MSNKLILLILVSFFLSLRIFAQNSKLGKYTISTQPLQFLCRELPITFERVHKRSMLGITLGYRFSSKLYENPNGFMRYLFGSGGEFTSPRFNGITLGANSKIFLGKQRIFYFDGHLFYRYWWFNDRKYGTNHSHGDNYNYLTSGQTNVIGLKFLLGMKKSFSQWGKNKAFCYYYFGLGYRFKFEKESGQMGITNYSIYTPYYQPYQDNSAKHLPSIHLGFSLGIEVFQKERLTE